MAFMEFGDKYKLGVEEVDIQHENLFLMVNKLYDSVVAGSERSVLGEILDELIDYTVEHFETEEKIFEKTNYPETEEHKKEHDDLTKQVVELREKFNDGTINISFDVLDFLNEWLKEHTTVSDMKYAKFIASLAK